MTTTTVSLGAITVDVADVTDVIVTDTQLDEESGYYVREIRVFGEPEEGSSTQPQVAVLRIRSLTQGYLNITAPETTF